MAVALSKRDATLVVSRRMEAALDVALSQMIPHQRGCPESHEPHWLGEQEALSRISMTLTGGRKWMVMFLLTSMAGGFPSSGDPGRKWGVWDVASKLRHQLSPSARED